MRRILVVEDSATQALQLRLALEREGFHVTVAPNAERALGLLDGSDFDLVLSDVVMPGLDGYELCRRLKAHPAKGQVPVILLTTLNGPLDILRGLDCGADNYLTKPYRQDALLRRIDYIFANRECRAAGKFKVGVELSFLGKTFSIASEKGQILDLLIATCEDVIRANRDLRASQAELAQAKAEVERRNAELAQAGAKLEARVLERTAELAAANAALRQEVEERRRAEETLWRREQEFHSLAENLPDIVARFDPQMRHLYVNRRIEGVTGIPPRDFVGKTDRELGFPEDLVNRWEEHLQHAFRSSEEASLEFAVPTPHGLRHFQSRLVPERANGGEPETVLCISHDITELRAAVEERDRFFNQSLNLLCLAGFDGYFHRLNPAWESTLGFTVQELLAEPFMALVHPDDREATLAEVRKLEAGGVTVSFEHRCRCKDGSYRWVIWSATPFLDQRGFYATGHDVTERKRLEEQLHQAQKMEAVGRLAGGVAHDFNNLLTVITGYGELLLGGLPPGDPNRDLVREMTKAGERAAGLTRQLLAFSRQAIVEPRVLNLKDVLAETDSLLRRVIGEDIELVTLSDPDVGSVRADPGQITQLLLNLAVNSRDAMPTGGRLTIEIRNVVLDESYTQGHAEARPGHHVLLAVSDTGCGIPAEVLSRIWEPFFTTKEVGKGTGLGLAVVHGVVKQAGGHVQVYSEVGHGTTFKVYLPRVRERPSSGKSYPAVKVMPRGTETVLLVEDEDGVRALASHVLAGCGYTVIEARDGAEAVRVAGEHEGRLDLLVTDVVMPHLGGRELAERLVSRHPGLKVLYLSGYTDDAVVRHGILEAEVQFLQKPYSPSVLALKAREVLDS